MILRSLCRLLILTALALPMAALSAEAPEWPGWSYCQSDDDCVIAGNNCEWLLENKSHRPQADQYLARPHKIECDPQNRMPVAVKCQFQKTSVGCKGTRPDGTCDIRVCTPLVANNEDLTVKKDGLAFEIVLPERVWSIPENKPGFSSSIKLGLKITNNSNKSFRFNGYGSLTDKSSRFNGYDALLVDIWTADSKEAHQWEGQLVTMRHRLPTAADVPLVMPGESVTFPIRADLFWPTLEDRTLMFRSWHASGSPARYYDNLKPGLYKVRIVYENRDEFLSVEELAGPLWIGRIVTPFVQVSLREREKDDASTTTLREKP